MTPKANGTTRYGTIRVTHDEFGVQLLSGAGRTASLACAHDTGAWSNDDTRLLSPKEMTLVEKIVEDYIAAGLY